MSDYTDTEKATLQGFTWALIAMIDIGANKHAVYEVMDKGIEQGDDFVPVTLEMLTEADVDPGEIARIREL